MKTRLVSLAGGESAIFLTPEILTELDWDGDDDIEIDIPTTWKGLIIFKPDVDPKAEPRVI